MGQEIVTIDGATFDKEALQYAVEKFEGANITPGSYHGISTSRYAILDDGDDDEYVNVIDLDGANYVTHGYNIKFFALEELKDATSEESFEDYVDTEVFFNGTYTYREFSEDVIEIAEFDDGNGYFIPEDIEAAVEDENVELTGIKNGWVRLRDRR